jgi:hypothetical protein
MLFNNNLLLIWLPTIEDQSKFVLKLKDILNKLSLDNIFIYKLQYQLFLHTKHKSMKVVYYLWPLLAIAFLNLNYNLLLALRILYE